MTDKFRIGIITKTHGIKGEVAVFPTSDDPERSYIIPKPILEMLMPGPKPKPVRFKEPD